MLWDLIQQLQLRDANAEAASLEERVSRLESELGRTNDVLVDLIKLLEKRFGEDLDADGRVA